MDFKKFRITTASYTTAAQAGIVSTRRVAISQMTPKNFPGRKIRALCPTWPMIKTSRTKPDGSWFTAEYTRILEKLSAANVIQEIGQDGVLLCYEDPGFRCHRRLVAEWLEGKFGIVIPELGYVRSESPAFVDMPKQEPKSAQKKSRSASLFDK